MRARGVRPSDVGQVGVHEQQRRCAVGDLRRGAGRVGAAVEHRLELGELLQRGLADALVGVDDLGVAGGLALLVEDGSLDGEDLAVEPTLVARRAWPSPATTGRTRRPRLGRIRGRGRCGRRPRTGSAGRCTSPSGRGRAGAGRDVGAEREAGHRLDAAGDAGLDLAGGDHGVDEMGGLLGRGALGVDHGGRGGVGKAGMHPGAAHHVVRLLAGLGHAATDDLVDRSASMPAREITSDWVMPSSTAGWRPASTPFLLPMGVRTASTITGVPMEQN